MRGALARMGKTLTNWRTDLPVRTSIMIAAAVGGTVLARLLSTITQIVLARRLGADNFGLYTALFALLSPVIIAASLGLDMWLVRQSSDTQLLHKSIGRVFSLRLLLGSGLMVGVIPFVVSHNPRFNVWIVLAAAVGLVWDLLLTTIDSALRARIRPLVATVLQFVVAAGLLGLIWFGWSDAAPFFVAVGYRFLATGAGLLAGWWLLRDSLRLMWQPRQWLKTVQQARVFFASEILANITLKADVTLLALLVGSIATGLYSPVLTLVNTTFLVPNITAQILLPMITRQPVGSRWYRLVIRVAFAGSCVYGLFWFGMFGWGAGWIIELLYGAQYRVAAPLLQIMCLIPLMKSFNFCSTTLMIAHNRQLQRTKLQLWGAIVSIVGNLVALPWVGLIGAAWVNTLAELVLLVAYGYGAFTTMQQEKLG